MFFFFKQKTAYEMRISDWSSDVCSSDLGQRYPAAGPDGPLFREPDGARGVTTPEFTGAMRVLAGLLEARTGQQLAINRIWRIETALKPLLRAIGMATLEDQVSKLLEIHDCTLLYAVFY